MTIGEKVRGPCSRSHCNANLPPLPEAAHFLCSVGCCSTSNKGVCVLCSLESGCEWSLPLPLFHVVSDSPDWGLCCGLMGSWQLFTNESLRFKCSLLIPRVCYYAKLTLPYKK